ncbi:hypothetical protein [Thiobacillus sp.]|uniref:hypothetical protein n=1 Tax=Thiobacillus sp. TaxID=924 RepID=UPI0034399B29
MPLIDVFNGDADGLCALHQLRLADPADSELVTGPKRDISLLKRVQAHAGDRITVLDIALSKTVTRWTGFSKQGQKYATSITTSRATFPCIPISSRTSIPTPTSAPACW